MTVERRRSWPCHCWEEGENLKSASTSWTVEWHSTADQMFAWAGDECLCKYKSLYISSLKEPHSLSVRCLCWSGVTRCSGWGWVREVGCIPEASWRLKGENQTLQSSNTSKFKLPVSVNLIGCGRRSSTEKRGVARCRIQLRNAGAISVSCHVMKDGRRQKRC